MANYIDCKLIVQGPSESINKFKQLTIKVDSELTNVLYDVCLTELMQGIDGVVTRDYFDELINEENIGESLLILDEFINDFEFNYEDHRKIMKEY